MHKIEWNELWSKVVKCYFKKLLLDNLFHKHLSSTHAGNLFFYFCNMFFSSILFCFIFFEPIHLIFLRMVHLILLSIFKGILLSFYHLYINLNILSKKILIWISFNYHNLANIFIHAAIEWHRIFFIPFLQPRKYIHTH